MLSRRRLLAFLGVAAACLAAPALASAATFSFSSSTYAVNEAAGTATITVGKSGPEAGTVNYATAPGTAIESPFYPPDYTKTTGTLNFAAGDASKSFTVPIEGDTFNDADQETFTVSLSSPSPGNALGSPATAGVSIADDDPEPTLMIHDARAAEDGGNLHLRIRLPQGFSEFSSATTGTPVTGAYTVSSGTATGGSDYDASSGSWSIPAGQGRIDLAIPLTADSLPEGNETFTVQLSGVVGATLTDGSAQATILDDDGIVDLRLDKTDNGQDPMVVGRAVWGYQLTVHNPSSTAARNITVTDTLPAGMSWSHSWSYSSEISEPLNTWNCSYNAALHTLSCTLGFIAGNDSSYVQLSVTPTSAGPFTNRASVSTTSLEPNTLDNTDEETTSTDVPGTLAFSAAGASVVEGTGGFNFAQVSVTRSGGAGGTAGATCSATGGTATVGQDYPAFSGQVHFSPGQTSATCGLQIATDSVQEPDETIELQLTSPTGGATLGTPTSATLTIQDDDQPRLTLNDVSRSEGNSGTTAFTFTASLNKAPAQAVSCSYTTADGTANAGSDYATASGTLTIPVGQTSATVDVTVQGDTSVEPDENFSLTLSSCSGLNATGNDLSGQGTILTDDSSYSFSSATYSGAEGTDITLTIVRIGALPAGSVRYTVTEGTARVGDYFGTTGALVSFSVGQTSQSMTLQTSADTTDEHDETFFATLSEPSRRADRQPWSGDGDHPRRRRCADDRRHRRLRVRGELHHHSQSHLRGLPSQGVRQGRHLRLHHEERHRPRRLRLHGEVRLVHDPGRDRPRFREHPFKVLSSGHRPD